MQEKKQLTNVPPVTNTPLVASMGSVAQQIWEFALQRTLMKEIALDELWKAVAIARKALGIARKED